MFESGSVNPRVVVPPPGFATDAVELSKKMGASDATTPDRVAPYTAGCVESLGFEAVMKICPL